MNKVFLLILLFDIVTATREIVSRQRRSTDENTVEKGNVEIVEVKTLNLVSTS